LSGIGFDGKSSWFSSALPKYDDDSAQAWLYGKLFVALLTEKLIQHAGSISPWGYKLALTAIPQPLA